MRLLVGLVDADCLGRHGQSELDGEIRLGRVAITGRPQIL